jgi:single-strand DNA-binding protein
MAGEVSITVVGRITADPEIRFIATGGAVCSFTVAHNSRKFNKSKQEWEDSEATFYRCSIWGHAAENVADTLRKGMAVIVQGAYGSRSWEANGEKKTVQEMRVDTIGLDLGFVKVDPSHIVSSTRSGQASASTPQAESPAGGSANDPWASTVSAARADEPPF